MIAPLATAIVREFQTNLVWNVWLGLIAWPSAGCRVYRVVLYDHQPCWKVGGELAGDSMPLAASPRILGNKERLVERSAVLSRAFVSWPHHKFAGRYEHEDHSSGLVLKLLQPLFVPADPRIELSQPNL
jgi:hypothetical protein